MLRSQPALATLALSLALLACAQPTPTVATDPPPLTEALTVAPTLASTQSLPTPTTLPATSIPTPLNPPTALPVVYHLNTPPADQIHYDFFDHLCEAKWSNGAHFFDCPGDITSPNGSANQVNAQTALTFATDNKALLTIPAYGNNNSSIFGHYPTYTVQPGDAFHAALTVAFNKNEDCTLSFGLDYYDAQQQYHSLIEWPINPTNALQEVAYDLSALQGQAVDFSLAVRYQGHDSCQALWIAPLIY